MTPSGRFHRRRRRPQKVKLVVEADEMGSFVGSKKMVFWVWVVLDAESRRVLAMVVGDRTAFTAECLWLSLPVEYREHGEFCTDFLPTYSTVIPESQHAAAGKEAGLTAHIERFWCTVRQRCSRVVRKTLSFSKCLDNHIGALWFFVHLYNSSR
jgi:insertion element IS1 protein InsB